jgi:hypothetical protein
VGLAETLTEAAPSDQLLVPKTIEIFAEHSQQQTNQPKNENKNNLPQNGYRPAASRETSEAQGAVNDEMRMP